MFLCETPSVIFIYYAKQNCAVQSRNGGYGCPLVEGSFSARDNIFFFYMFWSSFNHDKNMLVLAGRKADLSSLANAPVLSLLAEQCVWVCAAAAPCWMN